ncbi:phosphoglycolate phosphatase [Ventosimonas gracilis]|uniref:Phosphoglycolate phosphatase n=1 Tax=Ventosimonas gracilis TaxID=1680762 RepID=A0A139SV92_9GAMM|nr:HAD-IA family hydrolase [Ventosimonas gracilis]KXU38526.1 phosphoglycolate phosphatase [Ventosimonas gracilis]
MRIDAVLFDMDGTLLDSAPDFIAILQNMRAERDLPPLAENRLREVISGGAQAMLCAAFSLSPESGELETLRADFLQRYQNQCALLTRPFEGIASLLKTIEQRGLPWGVATNKPLCYAAPIMQQLALSQRAAVLLCPDHVANPKPAPDMLLLACKQLKLPARGVLYIGDDRRDIEAGIAAGMLTAAALWGYIQAEDNPADWGADFQFADPKQLQYWLENP